MEKHRFNLITIVFLGIALFIGVFTILSGNQKKPTGAYVRQIATPEPALAQEENQTRTSPNGKVSLELNKRVGNTNATWTFNTNGKQIFKEVLSQETNLTLPLNTFSPDNKYFFLKKASPGVTSYEVFLVSGMPFTEASLGLDFSDLFYNKYADFKITDVTGWAAPNLIIINTDKAEGGQGPTFWFDISGRSFIRLATRFN